MSSRAAESFLRHDQEQPGGDNSETLSEEVRAVLEKILGSAGFLNSERMRRFLRTTVERTLDGSPDQLKELVLGHDVFDRGANYDPRTDSIVRVEARRLRRKLSKYYQGEGLLDQIIIQLPSGKYIPTFSRASVRIAAGILTEAPQKHLDPKAIAVLPFSNLSSNAEQNYFCDGITEDIIDALSTVSDLHVLGRGTTFTFRDVVDPREIGAKLGVGTIVEGSARKNGGMLRVSARLIDTETGRVRWSTTVDRPETDVFAIKDEIATSITSTLCDHLSGVRLPLAAPNIDAYALYLKGRHAANRMDGEGFRSAIDYYTRAIAEFPDYAPPYSGLADVYIAMSLISMDRPSSLMPLAKQAATEALRLDSGLAHAYSSLAWVVFSYEWNWSEGMALAQKAIMIEPNYAFGQSALGAAYMILGRIPEARERFECSLQLDPLSVRAGRMLGFLLMLEGRFEESIQRLLAARALAPNSHELAYVMSGVFLAQGRFDEGLRYAQECQRTPPNPRLLGMLGEALAQTGRESEALEILKRIEDMSARQYVDSWTFCRLHLALREYPKALDSLERSLADRSPLSLIAAVDPRMEPLRKDRRFREIIGRLNLPARPRSVAAKR